jgi:KTSC domain
MRPGQKSLEIELVSGCIYLYLDVDRRTYDALLAAPSKGTYFNAHIKDQYEFVRIV